MTQKKNRKQDIPVASRRYSVQKELTKVASKPDGTYRYRKTYTTKSDGQTYDSVKRRIGADPGACARLDTLPKGRSMTSKVRVSGIQFGDQDFREDTTHRIVRTASKKRSTIRWKKI